MVLKKTMITRKGFTLIELLVVVAIIALLLAVVLPSLGKAKEYAKRVVCASNYKQQALGVILYADGHDYMVPCDQAGSWFWDLSFAATNQITEYAGIDDNEVYFCPANRLKRADDARFWQHSWVFDWGDDLTQPLALRDESVLTNHQLKLHFRVMPSLYMFDRIDPVTGQSLLPNRLETGDDAVWIRKLTDVKNSSAQIMVMDSVISEGNAWNFFEISTGGVGIYFNSFDNSNHASRQKIHRSSKSWVKPAGANIAFVDGHVDWRRFDDMEHRLTVGQWFWW